MAEVKFSLNYSKPKPNAKKIIALWSAKGGVGKTSIAISLAYALSKEFNVGLFDADIDCPNIAEYLGINKKLMGSKKENRIYPIIKDGIRIVSMGNIYDDVVFWRGPMITQALKELLIHTEWGDVDFLVVDMPPGTSDVALTMMQEIRPDGVFLITTPSKMALKDLEKSKSFLKKFNIKLLGIVGNMCGDLFGNVEKALGCIPLSKEIAKRIEEGKPFNDLTDVFDMMVEKVKEV